MIPGTSAPRRSLPATAAVLAAASVLVLTSCSSEEEQPDDGLAGGMDTGGAVRGEGAPLYDLLPGDVQEAGVIEVGSDIDFEPVEFINEDGEIDGIDPDIADALADVLGVEFTFVDTGFDDLIPAMNAGEVDIVMSGMTDTRDRQEGASSDGDGGADFINYFSAGSALLVPQGNPNAVDGLSALCGSTVALQRGTANEELAQAQSDECDTSLEIVAVDQDSEAAEELSEGRVDVVITDYPVALHQSLTVGDGHAFEMAGDQIDAALYGIAVPRDQEELRDALHEAVQAIIDDGTYLDILTTWQAENGAVAEATVNAGE